MYFVYILANKKYGTLYIGMTNNLQRRTSEHVEGKTVSFSHTYRLNKLVYFEQYQDVREAIRREKQLKDWNRQWKIELIDSLNLDWQDLKNDIPHEY